MNTRPLVSKAFTGNQLLNPNRAYTSAVATDVRATFARIRAEREDAKPSAKKANVTRIRAK